MRKLRLLVLSVLASGIGGAVACVGNEPATGGTDSDAAAAGDAAGSDGSTGSDGSSSGDSGSNADSGGPSFCDIEGKPDSSADFFCADFDGVSFGEGFVDASVTDGSTLSQSVIAAFSEPDGLLANITQSSGLDAVPVGASLYWEHGGTSAVTSMSTSAEILSNLGGGAPTYDGFIYLMSMHTGNVQVDYGFTKGGDVDSMTAYTGYLVHVDINGNNNHYYAVDSISTTQWTKVSMTFLHGSSASHITLVYDATTKLDIDTAFPGNNGIAFSAAVGPQTFGDTLGGSWSFDNFEATTYRGP